MALVRLEALPFISMEHPRCKKKKDNEEDVGLSVFRP
jgi:hypothetical protein